MTKRRPGPRALDPRLAAYVTEHWDDLTAEISDDSLDQADLVLDALTRIALARPIPRDADLDGAVRREVARAVGQRLRRSRSDRRGRVDDHVVVDVVEVAPSRGPSIIAPATSDPAPARATDMTPTVLNPVESLRARVRRARRGRAVSLAAAAAAVVVVTMLVVTSAVRHHRAAARGGPDAMQQASFARPVALPRSPESRPTGVAVGGGHLWTLELHLSSRRPATAVVERDLSTGRREASYPVPGEDFGISYALRRVWVWGVASRATASVITGLDPTTGATWTKAVDTDVIGGAGFTAHRAWFAEDGLARVLAVTPAGRFTAVSLRPPGVSHVASAGPRSVVVSGASDVMQVLPAGWHVAAEHAPPTLLASTPTYGVWIGDGTELSYRPEVAAPESLRLRLPLRVALVVGDPAHGVYVATSSTDPQHFDPYLVYYSPRSLRAAHPRPTARLDGRVRVEGMAGVPSGGLVFVTTDGQIEAWDPAAVVAGTGSPDSSMR